MSRAENAVQLYEKKYNCAQAVICSFKDCFDLPERDIFKASEALGFGMGTMGTCGAVSGMAVVIGLLNSDGNLKNPSTKKKCYEIMAKATEEFMSKNKSILCGELRGEDDGVPLRSCNGCIADAVEILENVLKKKTSFINE